MKVFIVIPVKNEEKHIGEFLNQLHSIRLPLVFVDDGSNDKSASLIKNAKLKNFTLLEHKINLGKGAAMKTGAEYAFEKDAEAIIFMDSDGQHKVSDLPRFTKVLGEGYEVVFGSRNFGMGVPMVRYLGNKTASIFVSLLFGSYFSDLICGFRALTKKAYKRINWESAGYGVETEIAVKTAKLNLKHCEVPVETVYYDSFKGVSLMDAFGVLISTIKWRFQR